jgi:hypothetical protein
MPMTPDEVVKVLREVERRHKEYDKVFKIPIPDKNLQALNSAITLIQDYQKLLKKEGEAQTVLDAWFSIFQTNQLTHAQARLEQAEKEAKRYQKLRGRVSVEKVANQIAKFYTMRKAHTVEKMLAKQIVTYLQQPTEH